MPTSVRGALKAAALLGAGFFALPWLVSYWMRRPFLGADRALEGSTQTLSLTPGVLGQYLRRAFLMRVLARFDESATVEFGTLFSQSGAQIGARSYIGPRCHIGLAHIGDDVLIGAGVHIPSGAKTHGTSKIDVPIREQDGARTIVSIGRGTWIGSGAIVMADVGADTVIGAGSVVTKPIPDGVLAVGAPAIPVRSRT